MNKRKCDREGGYANRPAGQFGRQRPVRGGFAGGRGGGHSLSLAPRSEQLRSGVLTPPADPEQQVEDEVSRRSGEGDDVEATRVRRLALLHGERKRVEQDRSRRFQQHPEAVDSGGQAGGELFDVLLY